METLGIILEGALIDAPYRAVVEKQWEVLLLYYGIVLLLGVLLLWLAYPESIILQRFWRYVCCGPEDSPISADSFGSDIVTDQVGVSEESLAGEDSPPVSPDLFDTNFRDDRQYIESFFRQAQGKMEGLPAGVRYTIPKGISYSGIAPRAEKPKDSREDYVIEIFHEDVSILRFLLDADAGLVIEKGGNKSKSRLFTPRKVGTALATIDEVISEVRNSNK